MLTGRASGGRVGRKALILTLAMGLAVGACDGQDQGIPEETSPPAPVLPPAITAPPKTLVELEFRLLQLAPYLDDYSGSPENEKRIKSEACSRLALLNQSRTSLHVPPTAQTSLTRASQLCATDPSSTADLLRNAAEELVSE